MAFYAGKFLRRKTLTSLISARSFISPSSRRFCNSYAKLEPLQMALLKGALFQPVRTATFHRSSNIKTNYLQKLWLSLSGGSRLRYGSILGVSVLFGSISFLPNAAAYAMDHGGDILVNDRNLELLGASDVEEDRRAMWSFARKFWLPFFFLATMLVHWDDPVTSIVTRIVLLLLSTNPSPFSVYVFVDEACHRLKHEEPSLFNKSLYARKVDVEDYKLLCLAKVEVRDQKYTLVGILGGWWPLPTLGVFKDRLLYSHKGL